MEEDGFSFPGAEQLALTFQELAASMKSALVPTGDAIVQRMMDEVGALYPPRLAPMWTESNDSPGDGELASVHVWTEDLRVYGWEYGTRPHDIPNSPKPYPRVLRFTARDGQLIYANQVHHPGTRPHNKRQTLEDTFKQVAEEAWSAALGLLMTIE